MGRIVEGRWKCPYCKTAEILGRYQVFPNCGRQRDKDFKLKVSLGTAELIE